MKTTFEEKIKSAASGLSTANGCSSENPVKDKPYKISYVLGTEAVREYERCVDNYEKWNLSTLVDLGGVSVVEFETQAELDAYIKGIEDATGYLESARIMTDKEWQEYLEEEFSDEDDD